MTRDTTRVHSTEESGVVEGLGDGVVPGAVSCCYRVQTARSYRIPNTRSFPLSMMHVYICTVVEPYRAHNPRSAMHSPVCAQTRRGRAQSSSSCRRRRPAIVHVLGSSSSSSAEVELTKQSSACAPQASRSRSARGSRRAEALEQLRPRLWLLGRRPRLRRRLRRTPALLRRAPFYSRIRAGGPATRLFYICVVRWGEVRLGRAWARAARVSARATATSAAQHF